MKRFTLYSLIVLLVLSYSNNCVANKNKKEYLESLYTSDFGQSENNQAELGFSLEGELGIISATGNAESSSINSSLVANHEMTKWSNRYALQTVYTRARNNDTFNTTAQRFNGNIEADYKLTDPMKRIFLFADYEDNRFDGFDKQVSFASGWAQVTVQSETTTFRYSVGPGYNFVRPLNEADEDASGLIVRASAEYIFNWSSGARLRQSLSTAAGRINVLSRSETSISSKIIGDLAIKLSFILDHNSEPGTDIQPLDTRTSVSLVYQFF